MYRWRFLLPIVAIVVAAGGVSSSASAASYELFDVSLPAFNLARGERIEAFECDVRGSTVRVNTPLQWNMSLDNGTGGRSVLRAHAVVGAAFFDKDHLDYFDDFITVAKIAYPSNEPMSEHFNVTVVLTIVNQDGEVRRIKFPLNKLILKASPNARIFLLGLSGRRSPEVVA